MPAARDPLKSLLAAFTGPVARTIRAFISTWGRDELDDEDTTSAKNNTSVVTQLTVDGHRLLFTGDAGVTALSHAADQISFYSLGTALRFIQIPHHGSRRNVGPTVLNRLIGKPVSQEQSRHIVALASTAKNGEPKHPRKAVIHAFKHRGTKVLATRGNAIRHFYAAPARPGWTAVDPEPYHWTYNDEVEVPMEKDLKAQNVASMAAIYVGTFLLLGLVEWGTSVTFARTAQLAEKEFVMATITSFGAVLSNFLPNSVKHPLVFLRFHHVLPGHRCKRICKKDPRFSMEDLEKQMA